MFLFDSTLSSSRLDADTSSLILHCSKMTDHQHILMTGELTTTFWFVMPDMCHRASIFALLCFEWVPPTPDRSVSLLSSYKNLPHSPFVKGGKGTTVEGECLEGHPSRVGLHGCDSIQDILYAEIPVPRRHEWLPPERDPSGRGGEHPASRGPPAFPVSETACAADARR